MDSEPRETDLLMLSVALGDLRDSCVLLSMALKDQFADEPSHAKLIVDPRLPPTTLEQADRNRLQPVWA